MVGYRVFLGNCQYFVSSDVGGGKMQWYAFHKEPAGGSDQDGMRKARLLQVRGGRGGEMRGGASDGGGAGRALWARLLGVEQRALGVEQRARWRWGGREGRVRRTQAAACCPRALPVFKCFLFWLPLPAAPQLFGHWSDNVVDLIKATPEEDILRRDIFDRAPIFKWSDGRTVLLGDSAHAMQVRGAHRRPPVWFSVCVWWCFGEE